MEGKRRRIFIIVSFLDCIQEKSMGRQQVPGNRLSQLSMICIVHVGTVRSGRCLHLWEGVYQFGYHQPFYALGLFGWGPRSCSASLHFPTVVHRSFYLSRLWKFGHLQNHTSPIHSMGDDELRYGSSLTEVVFKRQVEPCAQNTSVPRTHRSFLIS